MLVLDNRGNRLCAARIEPYWGYTKIPAKAVIGLGEKCPHVLYAQFLRG
jgi:hypothetical protein